MDPVHARVAAFLWSERIPRAARLLVGVSGGADSMALLRVLAGLGQPVVAAHVHHGLRGAEADADLAFVRQEAARLGIGFRHARVDAGVSDGRSPEARARALRYAALERLRHASAARAIATAHTLDDQAETVLLRAIRGTGPRGLAGIRPSAPGLLRPLLEVRRAEIRAYLAARGAAWREDPSNRDPRFSRNRVRAQVLPLLEDIHPGATRRLAGLARVAGLEERALEAEVLALEGGALVSGAGGVWLDVPRLRDAPALLRRRLIARLLRGPDGEEQASQAHVERVDAFLTNHDARGRGRRRISLPGARTLEREGARAWLGPLPGPRPAPRVHTRIAPGRALEFPERGLRLTWHREGTLATHEGAQPLPHHHALRVSEARARSLLVRGPEPGDRLVDAVAGARPLAALFAKAGWSARRRGDALVVAVDEGVVWVPGLASVRHVGQVAEGGWRIVARTLSTSPESC